MFGELAHPQIVHLPMALSIRMPLITAGILLAWHRGAAVAGTVVILTLGYQTGKAGGELVDTHGAAQAFARPVSGSITSQERDDDD